MRVRDNVKQTNMYSSKLKQILCTYIRRWDEWLGGAHMVITIIMITHFT